MTRLSRSTRRRDDSGSVLVMALLFMTLFAVLIGTVLQFSRTSIVSGQAVRDEGSATYSADGAADAAVNAIRLNTSSQLDPGTTPIPTNTCLTLPAGQLDNQTALTVTCQPRTGSGTPNGSTLNVPASAILTPSVAAGTEGVTLTAGAQVDVKGPVRTSRQLTVPTTSRLTSTTGVAASVCSVQGTVTPAPQCGAVIPPNPATDPALTPAELASWTKPTSFPPMVMTLPGCATPVVAFSPGTYADRLGLQNLINTCANTVFWFQPGIYNFDFRDAAGGHEWVINPVASSVIVGGAPAGWVPGTTPPAAVPYPGVGRPAPAAPGASACDSSAAGVEFLIANDSRMTVTSGKVQLCPYDVGATRQHVTIYGPSTTTTFAGTTLVASPIAKSVNAAGAAAWTNPDKGGVIDGAVADVTIPVNSAAKAHSVIEIGPFPLNMVPPDASGVTVQVDTTHQLTGTGTATMVYIAGDNSGTATQTVRDCSAAACNDAVPVSNTVVFGQPVFAAQANGGSLRYDVGATNNAATFRSRLDGLKVTLTFSAPLRQTINSTLAAPMLKASGVSGTTTVLAIHGTVHAPLAVIDLGMTLVENTVIDRGVIARHLQLGMTPAAGFAGQPLISVPVIAALPRQVLLTVADGSGRVLLRAEATFADLGGTVNGVIPTVVSWSHQ